MTESSAAIGTEPQVAATARKLALPALTAMVVGSMVGAGVFSLPRNFGHATGVFGALIAWAIAGCGMLMLAFVFQILAVRKPHLDSGMYAYAKAGFGEFPGFLSAFGYWASACVGNATYWILIKSTLGPLIPGFGEGNTLLAIAVSTIGVWAFAYLILRGVEDAAIINQIVTVAKLLPILTFVVILAVTLKADVFSANFYGGDKSFGGVVSQVRATMLVTVFVFLGVEGASVYSNHAQRRSHVGRATVMGLLSVLALFASVTILSYGALPRAELGELRQPSMGAVLESVVGHWGSVFISAGLIVSVLGAYLAWTLMAAEVLFTAARDKDMPRFLRQENRNGAPSAALVLSAGLVTAVLLFSMLSDDAFTFTLELTSALSLIPYLLAAAYALKLVLTRETYTGPAAALRNKHLVISGLATIYTAFLLWAAGLHYLLLSCVVYAPGVILFVRTRQEQRRKLFTSAEGLLMVILCAGAIAGIVGLSTGGITI